MRVFWWKCTPRNGTLLAPTPALRSPVSASKLVSARSYAEEGEEEERARDNARARLELAALYRDMGQPQVGRGVLAADGDLVLARRYAALIYSALGRQEEALASYEGLARLQPADASIQISLGIVHSQRGDWAAAEEAFKRALSLGNDGGDAALKLGGLYVHKGRLRAAVKVFADGAALNPDNAELHASLGDCIQETGRARCGTGGR